MDEIIEMLWECRACGTNRNRGRFKDCEGCGAPRTDASPEYMPDDVQAAPVVTDPELLRKARGGHDWACRYCGGSAFRADGACEQCGSPKGDSTALEGASDAEHTPPPDVSPIPDLVPTPSRRLWIVAVAAVAFSVALWALLHERVYDVRVADVTWRSTVSIERYAVRNHESFAEKIAAGAFARTSLGQRHHHDERILDHYVPVPYTVNEFAGYRTETYSAQEACGQSCYSTPRVCTSNKNGFASCTGGGQHCSTKYCSVTKTRQVSYTKPVVHIRQDPVYRSEPRFAEWYAWKAWEWGHDHDVSREGVDTTVVWPPAAELTLKLGPGERQRETKALTMRVVFARDEERFQYAPQTERELARFAVGTAHRIRKATLGAVQVVDQEERQ